MNKILVTGAIGFIGYHLTKKLIHEGYEVVGIDNINDYYNTKLKYDKLPILGIDEKEIKLNKEYLSKKYANFKFAKIDIRDREKIEVLFAKENFDIVCNLAAQAGVKYSIENPHTYVENNVTGFINILDACRQTNVKHFIFASSSSVYGNSENVPFKETDNVDHPISIYAASKKSNELMAHTYSHLYNLKTTGLRFFTVYGPWGRPDMAPFIFTKNIIEGNAIRVFNDGNMERDFTYVDDIINGIIPIIEKEKNFCYKIYNIGNSSPVNLNDFIKTIEDTVGITANISYQPMRDGDVIKTYADTTSLFNEYGYKPTTPIKKGITSFIDWYKNYFSI